MKLAVVILAAGASSRMGRPKLLLPWNGTSVVANLIAQWEQLNPAQITVVTAVDHKPIHDELARAGILASQFIFNPTPGQGMFSSVQCAARWRGWRPEITHWAVALGDQPLVRPETLRSLIQFASTNEGDVHQPSRNGRGRHPVILARAIFAQLAGSPVENLKQFLLTCGARILRCEMDDAGLDLDLDEPADYQRALAMASVNTSYFANK